MRVRTAFLILAFAGALAGIGTLVADHEGALLALAFAVISNGWSFCTSDERVLRTVGAREVKAEDEPDLVTMVGRLAALAGLPAPRLYVADLEMANALSVGCTPRSGGVIVTTGLLYDAGLDANEIAGVIAHELAHIKARDAVTIAVAAAIEEIMLIAASLFALIGFATRRNGGLGLILFGAIVAISSVALKLAVGRSREYSADARAAAICGHPEWLASALRKLAWRDQKKISMAIDRPVLFSALFIDALPKTVWARLLATHPPIEKRLARLDAMCGRFDASRMKAK